MQKKWFKVRATDREQNVRGFALQSVDELAAVRKVIGWLETEREVKQTNAVWVGFDVFPCKEPSSLADDGSQQSPQKAA